MEKSLQTKNIQNLYKAILQLKTEDECAKFFRDLCTISEIKTLSERWNVAKLIGEKLPYREISRQTKVSTTTISRVAHWLNHGEGGYKTILNKLKTSQK